MAQSLLDAHFTSKIMGSILATDSYEKSLSKSAKTRGLSPGTPVSFHKESLKGG